jgi:hypothetical protein
MSTANHLNTALIIFVRPPELGKVKTRLAKTIGDVRALAIYKLLLNHTQQITQPLNFQKFIYYVDHVVDYDLWNHPGYTKRKQSGNDLGEKMQHAFNELFEQGFKKVLIIGSDCYQLQTPIIEEAVNLLNTNGAVLGPTHDGGYFLLGMNEFHAQLFENKTWSTDQVLNETVSDLKSSNISYSLLNTLCDVDEEADLALSGIDI